MNPGWSLPQLESLIEGAYIDAPGATVRDEDRKKARELDGLLREVARSVDASSRRRDPLKLVDAAAGKAYVGLIAARLVAAPRGRDVSLTIIEREASRLEACKCAAERLAPGVAITYAQSDVGDPAAWPDEPDLVVALHACGDATDRVIERVIGQRARQALIVPCCVAAALPAARRAQARADRDGMPLQSEVRRLYVEAMVLAERVLTLEAAGWETVVVAFVAPTVTPYNRLLRARRVGEEGRMRDAARRLALLRS